MTLKVSKYDFHDSFRSNISRSADNFQLQQSFSCRVSWYLLFIREILLSGDCDCHVFYRDFHDMFVLQQHITQLTREKNLQDVVVTDADTAVTGILAGDATLTCDHHLITC
jgi:hypothetical protein